MVYRPLTWCFLVGRHQSVDVLRKFGTVVCNKRCILRPSARTCYKHRHTVLRKHRISDTVVNLGAFCSAVAYPGDNTIFSLSSGHGKCGVAVVRVSGTRVREILQSVGEFSNLPTPRKAVLRMLVDPQSHDAIDKGLVLYFPGPDSFTGEDCVEFQVHGGPAVLSALLTALYKVPGCRQAEAGEFTKRAFLNGKLDLTEVEGLGDLIHAETEAQRRQALRQMDGDLSQLYTIWRGTIIKCVADIEAYVDFAEDQGIEDGVIEEVTQSVMKMQEMIQHHLNDNRQGERLREGVHVAIVGQPNVGKSSLLNRICRRPAAIVTEVAGTTRDVIETPVNIGGYPVVLSDTAGLRLTEDIVEQEGIQRALARARLADLRILMIDLDQCHDNGSMSNYNLESDIAAQLTRLGVLPVEFLEDNPGHGNGLSFGSTSHTRKTEYSSHTDSVTNDDCIVDSMNWDNTIVVFNKSDLVDKTLLDKLNHLITVIHGDNGTKVLASGDNCVTKEETDGDFESVNQTSFHYLDNRGTATNKQINVCFASCLTGEGLDDLLEVLRVKVADMCGNPLSGHPSLTQARHRSHLTTCLQHLKQYHCRIHDDDLVLASQALRRALREIGKITGKITSEEILDVIFQDFCIGK